jgi:hypothetical protein
MSYEDEENTPEKQINAILDKQRKAINARFDQFGQQFLAQAHSLDQSFSQQEKILEVVAYMDKSLAGMSLDLAMLYAEMDLIHSTLKSLVPKYEDDLLKTQKKVKDKIKKEQKKMQKEMEQQDDKE